ncbi:ubiquinone biosynthesis accessory factor UbiJ [Paludibacterium paludis]|uniref:Ubiquinone biosynthesis accessory factor UbiJ n=1 Tax=Paludibacterium paludis TaxID=1225769 RepID=A0A918U6X3_9NEIS|nr:sterol-binding protein [Paludibacterium paludis]GGY02103.1 hypothetical protein GCM10011289_00200 [Paludibacterium paludis]
MRIGLAVFNHLLKQTPEARAMLAAHAGRRVAWRVPPVLVSGVVTGEGWLAECDGEPEAVLALSHAAVLSALAGKDPALSDIAMEGDAELAGELARISGRLSWHWVEDLSRLAGDAAASRAERAVRRMAGARGEIVWRLAESWIEHLRDEAPLLARKSDVDASVTAIDELRDDCERFEKRLRRAEDALQRHSH